MKNQITALLFLFLLTLLVGYQTQAFVGFPKGEGAMEHLTLIRIIQQGFPNIFWNPYFNGGEALFSSASFYHLTLGVASYLLPIPLVTLVNLVSVLSLTLVVAGIFLIILVQTRKIIPSLFGGLVFLGFPGIWHVLLSEGDYSQSFLTGIFVLLLLVGIFLFRFKKIRLLLTFLLAGLCLLLVRPLFTVSFDIDLPQSSFFPFYLLPMTSLLFTFGLVSKRRTGKRLWLWLLTDFLGLLSLVFLALPAVQLIFPASLVIVLFLALRLNLFKFFPPRLNFLSLAIFLSLLALIVGQVPKIKIGSLDSSKNFSSDLRFDARLAGLDNRLFRFTSEDEALGSFISWSHPSLRSKNVFAQTASPNKIKFLLDWYAVKYFYLDERNRDLSWIMNAPDEFAKDREGRFIYKRVAPLLEATDANAVLFVGEEKDYQAFLSALAAKNLNSRLVIPSWGTADKDKEGFSLIITAEDLENDLSQIESFPAQNQIVDQQARFISNQRREINLQKQFKGVVLRETYSPNWRAWIESGGKKQFLKIYQAGPKMMYSFLPDLLLPAKIIFGYNVF